MSKISDKLNTINNAKNDIKTAIENKGISVGDIGIQEYASKIDEMQVATPLTKGLIINAYDSDGYPTDVSIVGMTELPRGYFYKHSDSYFSKLKNVNLPSDLTTIGYYCFYACVDLSTINGSTELPSNITSIDTYGFYACSNLTITKVPIGVNILNGNTFYACTGIKKLDILSENLTSIGMLEFSGCTNLTQLIIRSKKIPSLKSINTFTNTPIKAGTGYIYVQDDLVEKYKTATNWSNFASQIKGISELPTE